MVKCFFIKKCIILFLVDGWYVVVAVLSGTAHYSIVCLIRRRPYCFYPSASAHRKVNIFRAKDGRPN